MDIDEKGMAAARERSEWELGDAGWAGIIVAAYLNPEQDAANLKIEKGE